MLPRPSIIRHFLALSLAVSVSHAKTVMILGDWFPSSGLDSVLRVDSMFVARYDTATRIGYFLGSGNQVLERTSAFAAPVAVHPGYDNEALPDSLRVPTSLRRGWFSIPDFSPGNYAQGWIQMKLSYVGLNHTPLSGPPSRVAVDSVRNGLGQIGQFPVSFLDSCLQRSTTDTVWLWSGVRNAADLVAYVPQEKLLCPDHDPFLSPRGGIRFLLTRPGARVRLLDGGAQWRMASDSGIWARYDLFDLPGSGTSHEVRMRVESSSGEVLEIDSAGAPFHIDDTGATHWIIPALDGRPARRTTARPTDSVVLAWDLPWDHQVPFAALGGGVRFAGSWKMGKGYRLALPLRPTSAFVASAEGGDSTAPVALPAPGKDLPDTVRIWDGPVFAAKDSFQLVGRAFDYALASAPGAGVYFPFSQAVTTGDILGLVAPRLGSDGLPRWTGQSICGLADRSADKYRAECVDSANAPSRWFVPHPGMNAEFPITFTLLPDAEGAATRSELLYFPLDSFLTLPDGSPNKFNSIVAKSSENNFGYCLVFHAEAELTDPAMLTIGADDDTWIFVDSQLVVDLGGIHGMEPRSANLASLSSPRPAVLPMDIFHCERHTVSSGMSLESNFPIRPVGWTRTAPRRVTSARSAKGPGAALSVRGGRFGIEVAAGVPWTLVLRSVDGRILSMKSGFGPASVPCDRRGLVLASLRTPAGLFDERVLGVR